MTNIDADWIFIQTRAGFKSLQKDFTTACKINGNFWLCALVEEKDPILNCTAYF